MAVVTAMVAVMVAILAGTRLSCTSGTSPGSANQANMAVGNTVEGVMAALLAGTQLSQTTERY